MNSSGLLEIGSPLVRTHCKTATGERTTTKNRYRLSFFCCIVLVSASLLPKHLCMYLLHQNSKRCLNLYNLATTTNLLRQNLRGKAHNISFILCFLGAYLQEDLEPTEQDFPKKMILEDFCEFGLFCASVL